MDVNTALQEVLKKSLIADGLVHGIHEACKALDKRQAVLCILAESCDEPQYKKLITALCNEHQIPLIRVDSNKKLGEWSGLCKIDKEGKPRKICGASCVVLKVGVSFNGNPPMALSLLFPTITVMHFSSFLFASICYFRISERRLQPSTSSRSTFGRQPKPQLPPYIMSYFVNV